MGIQGLLGAIEDRSARVAVVGLGYVGFPLAQRIKEVGFPVLGIDVQLSEERLKEVTDAGIEVTDDYSRVPECDVILLCVPTPLDEHQQPDISYITSACSRVAENYGEDRAPKLVVLESTTYPGTTREVVLPIFETAGLTPGQDVFIAYAPERIDPGGNRASFEDTPRVVGGLDEEAATLARAFYSKLVNSVVTVSRPEVAEMAKLLENVFRAVNIALINEMSLLCREMDIDIWEVVDAASTKPFGFMPFYPGPGLGSHCIPVDPFYLTWKAKQYGYYADFIELAGRINSGMPRHVANWVVEAVNNQGKSIKAASILVIGVAYKPDIDDVRNSPALEIIETLRKHGARVFYHDSMVPTIEVGGETMHSVGLTPETLDTNDCVVIVTAHSDLDTDLISASETLVVDSCNALPRTTGV